MDKFPFEINATNKDSFKKIQHDKIIRHLRTKIYDHIISCNENNYFDLDKFNTTYTKNMDSLQEMIIIITKELEKLGWKCKLSFGDTGMFIYSSDKPPPSCWSGEF
jgi:hypothetical protein